MSNNNIFTSCGDLLDKIPWRKNQQFPETITLAQAIEYGKDGKDDGLWGVLQIIPLDDNCEMWLSYYGYLQMMYELYVPREN